MLGIVPIVAAMSVRNGGGFHGTPLQLIVLISLIGVLVGFILGVAISLVEHNSLFEKFKLTLKTTIDGLLLGAFLAGGIVGITEIVKMV